MTEHARVTPQRPMQPQAGTCSSCRRKREVYRITRQGGGTYRRAQRAYGSSICAECVCGFLGSAARNTHALAVLHGYDVATLIDIAENLVAAEPDLEVTTYVRYDGPWDGHYREPEPVQRRAGDLIAEYRTVVEARLAEYKQRQGR